MVLTAGCVHLYVAKPSHAAAVQAGLEHRVAGASLQRESLPLCQATTATGAEMSGLEVESRPATALPCCPPPPFLPRCLRAGPTGMRWA